MKRYDFGKDWHFRTKESGWKKVTLPHDAQLLDQRKPDAPGGSGHGYFVGNVYEYEKKFFVEKDWAGKHIELLFEGIYKNAVVELNGRKLAEHRYGYTPFTVVLDEALDYEGENLLKVTADNSLLPNSRWYTGGGIYRPVSILVGEDTHITWQGVHITTLGIHPVKILVETNTDAEDVQIEILDNKVPVAKAYGKKAEIELSDAKLWSETSPYLYEARVTALKNDKVADEVTEKFGIRQITWSPKGLFINGVNTLLRGGCIHHDNGIIGAASYAESEWRRVRILKEQGFNAIRVAHNPASTAMLEACDHYGMCVMDETFDMWYVRKTKYDYGLDFKTCWKEDVRAMVERDYNHPSVIMYSIGNEVSEPGKPEGVAQGKEIIAYVKSLDGSRAVTGGMNLMIMTNFAKGKGQYDNVDAEPEKKEDGSKKSSQNGSLLFNTIASFVGSGMNKGGNSKKADEVTTPILDALDIAGYNYANGRYPMEGEKHPNRIIVGSETFPYEIGKNWDMVRKYPYLIGDFMWTAWDYLGEAGLGAWSYTGGMPFNRPYPWLLGGAGTIDILGNPDASMGLAKTAWKIAKKPVIGVRPVNHPGVRVSKSVWRGTNAIESWSWKNCEGNKALIDVFADADVVELFVNGKLIGKKKIKEYQALFKTSYEPGTIEAVAYDRQGKEISRNAMHSATGKTHIEVRQEKQEITDGDIAYFDIEIQGENRIVESYDDRKLKISVEGGELLGFGSGNPCTEESYTSGEYTTYYGRAQAIVRIVDPDKLNVQVENA